MGICVGILFSCVAVFGIAFLHFFNEALKEKDLIYASKENNTEASDEKPESGSSSEGNPLDRILVGGSN